MTFKNKLMGFGMPAGQALQLTPSTTPITCAGASAGGSPTAITQSFCVLTAASSQTGAILPAFSAATCQVGDSIKCYTTSSTSAVVYPATGETVNNNSSVTVAQYKLLWLTRASATNWAYIISA